MGRFDEAEPLLIENYDRLTKAKGESDTWTIGAAQMLVELYEARQQPAEAARWRSRIHSRL